MIVDPQSLSKSRLCDNLSRKWFSMLTPLCRDSFCPGYQRDNTADDSAGRVPISQTADCPPERLLIVIEMLGRAPECKGNRVLGGYSRPIPQRRHRQCN